ncbi:MAG: 2-dehydropantoate 2-reductase [Betaproteobacteria bacterium]|nr:2-dehydropantoate 2-reductase [Betaproteobacteria bacterium]
MHYIVAGAGAIGCYVGGALAAAGARVSFVGRPRIVEALRGGGLKVTDLEGRSVQVPPSAFAAFTAMNELTHALTHELKPVPNEAVMVLLCVKGGATAETAREIAAAFPAGTPVLSLQNGVDNVARIRAAAPGLTAIPGMVPFNVIQPRPGEVHRATSGVLRAERNALTESLLPDFAAAQLPLQLEADMRAVQWGKLLLNLNNPVNALSGLPLREELRQRDYRRVFAALIDEALAVLAAARIAPAKVATSPGLVPVILGLPDIAFRVLAAPMLRIDPTARSSMWDDLQAGRESEIGDLCGAVMRLGAAHGVATPVNAKMLGLIAGHTSGTRYSGAELIAACGI